MPGSGSYSEAQNLQNLISNADGTALRIGVRIYSNFKLSLTSSTDCGHESAAESHFWVWEQAQKTIAANVL